jgi:hypothetical protein
MRTRKAVKKAKSGSCGYCIAKEGVRGQSTEIVELDHPLYEPFSTVEFGTKEPF